MEQENNKTNIKIIYWIVTLTPFVLLNLSPYFMSESAFPQVVDNDAVFYDLVFKFTLIFLLFLLGIVGSFKCFVYSEFIITKIIAGLFLVFYVVIDLGMVYIILSGYLGG